MWSAKAAASRCGTNSSGRQDAARRKTSQSGRIAESGIYFSLRTGLDVVNLAKTINASRRMGNAGHRHVACGYWLSPDH